MGAERTTGGDRQSAATVIQRRSTGGKFLLAEPLLKGLTWTSSGGAGNDVTSSSRYLGHEQVTVPAFPGPVTAAKVRTEITQTGAGMPGTSRLTLEVLPTRSWRLALRSRAPCDSVE